VQLASVAKHFFGVVEIVIPEQHWFAAAGPMAAARRPGRDTYFRRPIKIDLLKVAKIDRIGRRAPRAAK